MSTEEAGFGDELDDETARRLREALDDPAEIAAGRQLAALDRAVQRMNAAEGKLAEVREAVATFLTHYGHSELPAFMMALDLAHAVQQVLDREPLERTEEGSDGH